IFVAAGSRQRTAFLDEKGRSPGASDSMVNHVGIGLLLLGAIVGVCATVIRHVIMGRAPHPSRLPCQIVFWKASRNWDGMIRSRGRVASSAMHSEAKDVGWKMGDLQWDQMHFSRSCSRRHSRVSSILCASTSLRPAYDQNQAFGME